MDYAHFSTVVKPVIIGHRGASGHALENSLAAFRIAATPGHPARCDGVELDIHVTSDGHFVVHHDPVLSSGEQISSLPLSRVRASVLGDGSPIPTLADAIETLVGLELFVEVKHLPPSADLPLVKLLGSHRGARWHLHAFDHRIIARLNGLVPPGSLGVLSASYPVDPVGPVQDAGAGTLWQQADLIDARLVAACHAAGVAVIAWTVNDRDCAATLTGLGVDGLCGNWPERLR